MLAVGEVGSWLPPWNPVHHLDSRLDSEAPRIQREEIKPTPERVRKKSRKKTAEPVVDSLEAERSASSSGGHHGDLATQERIEQLRQKYGGKTDGGEREREDCEGGGTFKHHHQLQREEEICRRRNEEEEEGVLGGDREEGEHNSLLFLEQEIEPSEVGSRLQDIDSQLEPCIGELIQIQQEIEALKNKFRKVEDESSVVKLDNIYEKMIEQEEEEERSKKEDDPRVNFRFAQIANEQDIQHMVGGQAGRTYKLEGLEKRDTGWRIRRGLSRAGVEAKAGQGWVWVKAAWGGQQAVSVAGCDMLRTFGLGEADLQPCIDRLSVGEEVIASVGEVVVGFRVHPAAALVLNRVVFLQGVRGLHLAWYTARELGLG